MFTKKISCISFLTFFLLILIISSASADTAVLDGVDVPEEWVDTYTPDELAAIDRALWAANLTREDLDFRKDYTEGYECFPIVRDWLAHPMDIAPDMDGMISGIAEWEDMYQSPISELAECLEYYPDFDREEVEGIMGLGSCVVLANPPSYTESLIGIFVMLGSINPGLPYENEDLDILREYVPETLSWHDVFESPYPEEQVELWDEMLETQPDDFLYQLMSRMDIDDLGAQYRTMCRDPREWLLDFPMDVFPETEPLIFEAEMGLVGIGTPGDDVWEGDFMILIDPGGNDHYINCRIGAAYGTDGNRFGYFVDLGGDDFYDCADVDITLGAAVLGIAAFYDLGQGNDRYLAGSCTLGAAMCGIATFYDDGGTDIYESKVYSQGAAGFGIGIMVDESMQSPPETSTDEGTPDPVNIVEFDNDRYYAWTNSQAFARTLGFAICSNERGNDTYEAGGVYLHAPLFADRYQSFSQGFAIGERGIDYAGGIALIVDYDGNDRYLGDIYNQGVGYWYSAGLVYDVAGNDMYEMTQYGQGSGIHLAVGGLIDVSGNDSYYMHNGLGTGGSHDFAASVLHDRGGNDQYFGNTSCNGGSLTNSAVIFIDRSGNDTYAGRRIGGINHGRPARGFISIGILIDLDGEDDYLGIMDNGVLWSHTDVGVGWDIMPPPPETEEEAEPTPDRGQLGDDVPMPEIIDYQGELTQEVFDELWEISVRWEVGDNRFIVPEARDRLIEFGPDVLSFLSAEFDNMHSGLAIRAFDYILGILVEDYRDGVIEILLENLVSDEQMRIRIALAEISTLSAIELEENVAEILEYPDPGMQRRAIGTLGDLGSHIADDRLIDNLDPSNEEALIKVCLETLFKLEVYEYDLLKPLLDHPYITVRETLIGLLVTNFEFFEQDLMDEIFWETGLSVYSYIPPPFSDRALRSVLKILAKAEYVPDGRLIQAVVILLDHEDWAIRADAIHIVRHWQTIADQVILDEDDWSLKWTIEPVVRQVNRMMETETDPYVIFAGTED